MVSKYPKVKKYDKTILEMAKESFEVISNIRNIRNKNEIAQFKALELFIKTDHKNGFEQFEDVIKKLANITKIKFF